MSDYLFDTEAAFRILLDRALEEANERHNAREALGDERGRVRDLEKQLAEANTRLADFARIRKAGEELLKAVRMTTLETSSTSKHRRRLRAALDKASPDLDPIIPF